jgi:hypothetical protein
MKKREGVIEMSSYSRKTGPLTTMIAIILASASAAPLASATAQTAATCSQAKAFLDRAPALDDAHQAAYGSLICGLVDNGVWQKLDVFYVFATQNSAAALLNLINTSHQATPVGTPSFRINDGYVVSKENYIDSNWNFQKDAAIFTQNAASMGGWSSTIAASYFNAWQTSTQYGGNTFIRPLNASDASASFSINGTSVMSVTNKSDGSGMFVVVRPDPDTESLYRNGDLLGSVSRGSAPLEDGTLEAGGVYSGTLRAMFAGGALAAADVKNFYSRMRAYMTTLGIPLAAPQ